MKWTYDTLWDTLTIKVGEGVNVVEVWRYRDQIDEICKVLIGTNPAEGGGRRGRRAEQRMALRRGRR